MKGAHTRASKAAARDLVRKRGGSSPPELGMNSRVFSPPSARLASTLGELSPSTRVSGPFKITACRARSEPEGEIGRKLAGVRERHRRNDPPPVSRLRFPPAAVVFWSAKGAGDRHFRNPCRICIPTIRTPTRSISDPIGQIVGLLVVLNLSGTRWQRPARSSGG
jgi:hypothetical protein